MLTSVSLAWKWVSSMAVPKLRFKDSGGREFPEWEERKLGTIANFIRGLSFNKNEVSNNKEDTLVIRSSNILENYRIDYKNDLQFVTKASSEEQFLKANDIVICLANGSDRLVGKSAYFDGNYLGKITVGAFCGILRTSNPVCKYLIQTWKYKQDISKIKQGGNGALANLYGKDILELNVFVPFFSEQQKIADFLTAYDTMIDTQTKRVEAMKLRKKGLLQKIFSQEIRFKDAEGREFPKWIEKKLGEVYSVIRNAFVGTATPYYVKSGFFYLESNNVKDGRINRKSQVFINEEFYMKQQDKWLHTGDIVIVQSGHVGHSAVIPESLDKTAAHALIMLQMPSVKVNPYYINYSLQTWKAKKQIKDITKGNTIKHILASDMKKFVVNIAPFEEQQKIASFLTAVDKQIEVEEKRLDTMKTIKKGLLQQMFV